MNPPVWRPGAKPLVSKPFAFNECGECDEFNTFNTSDECCEFTENIRSTWTRML
jgi:hypothetical protein